MYWIVFVYLFFLSFYAFGEQLLNQDVDIASGSTVSNDSGLTIQQLTGGPYTIENEGTIEASNITSALLIIFFRLLSC